MKNANRIRLDEIARHVAESAASLKAGWRVAESQLQSGPLLDLLKTESGLLTDLESLPQRFSTELHALEKQEIQEKDRVSSAAVKRQPGQAASLKRTWEAVAEYAIEARLDQARAAVEPTQADLESLAASFDPNNSADEEWRKIAIEVVLHPIPWANVVLSGVRATMAAQRRTDVLGAAIEESAVVLDRIILLRQALSGVASAMLKMGGQN